MAAPVPPVAAAAAVPAADPPPPVVPAEYVLVLGEENNVEASELLTETATIRQALHWIGFRTQAMRENLREQSLGTMDDMLSLSSQDVTDISKDWANRTAAGGQFHVGTK